MLHRVKAERVRAAFAVILLVPILLIMAVSAREGAWWGVALVVVPEGVVFYCIRRELREMKNAEGTEKTGEDLG